jgi:hypothetical protein
MDKEEDMETWIKLARSERARFGHLECDVWRFGHGARYSVQDIRNGVYLKGGQCRDLDWAKEVSRGFALSIIAILEQSN